MTNPEAIIVIKNNWPDSRYTMLREALTMAITLFEKEEAYGETNICPVCSGKSHISNVLCGDWDDRDATATLGK